MDEAKDSHVITIYDANTSQTDNQTSTSEGGESTDVQSEDIDALSNESSPTISNVPISTANAVDAICEIETVEDESVSNVINSADLPNEIDQPEESSFSSLPSLNSIVCRICHNAENPEKLVSPCNCRGTLAYVHIYCLERWISTSRCTTCELCHFQYHTEQTLRYTCFQSLRIYYSRHISRRTLQEDCQMFSMLTLVAFGIVGTLLVGLQYYLLQGNIWGIGKLWTKGWLLFFLFTTLAVYVVNIYLLAKSQLVPWYRWWQSARDIKLILDNRKPHLLQHILSLQKEQAEAAAIAAAATTTGPTTSTDEEEHTEETSFAGIRVPPPLPLPPMYNLREVAKRLYLEMEDDGDDD